MNSKPRVKYIFSSVQGVKLLKAGLILFFSLPNIDLENNPYNLKLPIFLEEEIRSRKEEEKERKARYSYCHFDSGMISVAI